MNNLTVNFENNDMFISSHVVPEQLPALLKDALTVAHTTEQKDMLLLSLLTNASYALPRMRAYHSENRHDYGPELMTMVLAPAASGKGIMNYGRRLMSAIEGEKGKQVYIPANASCHKLLMHAALMFDLLPDTKPTELTTISGSLQQKQFYDSLPQSFSRTDADHLANTLGVSAKSEERWLTEWTKCSKLQRVTRGLYEKVG